VSTIRIADPSTGRGRPFASPPIGYSAQRITWSTRAQLAALELQQNETRGRAEEAERSVAQAQEDLARAVRQHREHTGEVKAAESRLHTIEELEASLEGHVPGTRAVVEAWQRGDLRGIEGIVSNLITTDERYARAMDIAFGARLSNIITARSEDAERAIEFLNRNEAGRATFMPLDTLASREAKQMTADLHRVNGVIGYAHGLVNTAAKYEGVVRFLVGSVLVVDTLQTGISLVRNHGFRDTIVTLSGEQITGGTSGAVGFVRDYTSQTGKLNAVMSSGTFVAETITGAVSGETLVVTSVAAGALFLLSPMAFALSLTTHAHLLSRAALAGAIALSHRDEHPDRCHQPATADVCDLAARLDRGAIGIAGQPPPPVQTEIVHVVPGAVAVGAVLAVAGDRAVDEPRVLLPQALVADPEAIQNARPERFEQHVGAAHEPQQHVSALLGLEIDADRSLAPVEREEHRALGGVICTLVVRRRPAHVVAHAGVLHLQDVGAEVGQHQRAEAAGKEPREVEDSDALERQPALAHAAAPAPKTSRRVSLGSGRPSSWRASAGVAISSDSASKMPRILRTWSAFDSASWPLPT